MYVSLAFVSFTWLSYVRFPKDQRCKIRIQNNAGVIHNTAKDDRVCNETYEDLTAANFTTEPLHFKPRSALKKFSHPHNKKFSIFGPVNK
jgi:hypothetical protein